MRIIIPVICLILFLLNPETWNLNPETVGVSDSNLLGCFSYHFFHASWLHLIINCICIYLLYNPVRTIWQHRLGTHDFFINMYCCAVFAGLFAAKQTPTVGLSGIVFAILGALLLLNPTKRQLQNYIYLALAVVIQLFFGKSNTFLHICAFALGALTVIIHRASGMLKIDTDE